MRPFIPLMLGLTTLTACYEVQVSCEHDHDHDTASVDAPTDEPGDEVVEDLENPMAYVGEAHNLYLDCTLGRQIRDAKSGLNVLVEDCGFDPKAHDIPDDLYYSMSNAFIDVSDSLYGTGVNAGMDGDELEILARADVILRHSEGDERYQRLADLEQDALAMDASDELLASVATLRASNDFWDDWSDGEDQKAGIPWWKIILADAAGALIGGVAAGPGGAIGLGTTCSTLVAEKGE